MYVCTGMKNGGCDRKAVCNRNATKSQDMADFSFNLMMIQFYSAIGGKNKRKMRENY